MAYQIFIPTEYKDVYLKGGWGDVRIGSLV